MVAFKLITDDQAVSYKQKKLRENVQQFRDLFLQKMAQEVVLNSPVDTGTYITEHEIVEGSGGSSGGVSSKGKPRNQPWEPNAQQGLNNLYADISILSEEAPNVTMINNAEHADKVEYEHGYATYASARRNASALAKQAAQEAKRDVI